MAFSFMVNPIAANTKMDVMIVFLLASCQYVKDCRKLQDYLFLTMLTYYPEFLTDTIHPVMASFFKDDAYKQIIINSLSWLCK